VIELKAKGESTNPFSANMASKNEAEPAVWKFKENNKLPFTLSTVIPSYITAIYPPTRQLREHR
jgi:hypothetical protein